jgi:signal transduction histidine kinase
MTPHAAATVGGDAGGPARPAGPRGDTKAQAPDDVIRFLRRLPLLAALDNADLARIARMARRIRAPAGRVIMQEGDPADGLYVLLRGRLEVTRGDCGEEVLLATHRPGAFVGEMALLGGSSRSATVRAVRPSELLVIDPGDFRRLLVASPDAALTVLRAVAERLAGTEATLLRREKLVSLGTLAAGLAHELNNPAAAASASARHLRTAVRRLDALARDVGSRPAAAWVAEAIAGGEDSDANTRPDAPHVTGHGRPDADARERLAGWLRDAGVPGHRAAAHALAAAGWDADRLADATRDLDAGDRTVLAAWLAARCDAEAVVHELSTAAGAISDVVAAVRTHVHLDRAPAGPVDLRAGIDAALVVLRGKLRPGVNVTVDIAPDVPAVEGHAGELSQVWANLIGNAADAMEGRGTLVIRAALRGSRVVVEFEDDGPGIPRAARSRIFEPFYTTKDAHAGMGLGLHIVRDVIVHRHGGRIDVRSRPGHTVFRVTLPVRQPARRVASRDGS